MGAYVGTNTEALIEEILADAKSTLGAEVDISKV